MTKHVQPSIVPRARRAAAPPRAACQLNVELLAIRPKVWRRLIVPDIVSPARLHRMLQVALGRTDSHLHQFEVGRARYGRPRPDWNLVGDGPIVDERRVTLAGANACPPKDVGGPPGFEYFLAAIANPKHPDHADPLAWCGGDYDPRRFDLAAVNAALRRVRP